MQTFDPALVGPPVQLDDVTTLGRGDLYPHRHNPFNQSLFEHPSAEYRGTPFWAWNSKLEARQLVTQIGTFKRMGMGGFHIHPRTGLDTAYLGDEYMELVRVCVEEAKAQGLKAWLYDEDRWPSGFGGGLVTREARFRAHHLLLTRTPYCGLVSPASLISNAHARRFENGVLLARYLLEFEHRRLKSHRLLGSDEPSPTKGNVWYAYLETAEPSPWWNNQTYVDTLNPAATRRFLEVTHERYKAVVGEHFGATIPAIFTDEPQFTHKVLPNRVADEADLFLPWTPDFAASYRALYGGDVFETLPEIFWERSDAQASLSRYNYHDHLAERFASAFADTVGAWCGANGLMLTGHMMEEPTLESQTTALGEAMRSYRAFHLPGIDMLCDRREYTTAKQAQSAAHQYGRPGMLSELYGVTNWDFDFKGHKAQGDWQAALGVTVRVHHLTWVSMAGEAKRDYPASIGYQSPWWREYPLIEDHFARVNTVLTRGQAVVRIGVIHPIESYWLAYGPLEHTAGRREELEQQFRDLTDWLLFGLQDFDFITESLFPELCPDADTVPLCVGQARYEVIVVPSLRTIRSSTLERLEAFERAGGKVIFVGGVPDLMDAAPSARGHELAARCQRVPWTRWQLLESLRDWNDISVQQSDGRAADSLLYQMRQDGQDRFVFLCNTDREGDRNGTRIRLLGHWRVSQLDTMTGSIVRLATTLERDRTCLDWDFTAHGHLLLHLEPDWDAAGEHPGRRVLREIARLESPVQITLSEPNVLLLDRAEFSLDHEPWQTADEVLRIDNLLRVRLGFPLKMDAIAQPWTITDQPDTSHTAHSLALHFTIDSRVRVATPQLALENANEWTVLLDGVSVPNSTTGWWVDEAIQTIALPPLEVGTHGLELRRAYGAQTNLEWCYLLGDFGVEVRGAHAQVTAPIRELCWGDWTRQGLPFYAGNVTYHATLEGANGSLTLEIAHFKTPLISVERNGEPLGKIAFAPYRLELPKLQPGTQRLEITAFGNRVNSFGALHNADPATLWHGPDAWRSEGVRWSEEYQLKPMGVLVAPRVLAELEDDS